MIMSAELQSLLSALDMSNLPRHVAIIMDGNGRWANRRGKSRLYGHREGAKSVRQVVELAGELYIPYLTVYAFSTENWTRPQKEVSGLLKLLMEFLNKEIDELHSKNVRVRIIGSKDNVAPAYLKRAHKITSKTWNNTGLNFTVLFNYGGRGEIVEAVKSIATEVAEGCLPVSDINSELVSKYLHTKDMPDPDLVIRTSGEMRLSNFLLWQTAYSELYITDTLWPDFDKQEFVKALLDFQGRFRKFGGINGIN